MSQRILFAVCLVFTFAVTVMILRKLIPFLKSKKMGQHILDIGPRWHRSKEGTPTMGGICFIMAIMFNVPCTMTVAATYRENHSKKWIALSVMYYVIFSLTLAFLFYHIGLLIW